MKFMQIANDRIKLILESYCGRQDLRIFDIRYYIHSTLYPPSAQLPTPAMTSPRAIHCTFLICPPALLQLLLPLHKPPANQEPQILTTLPYI